MSNPVFTFNDILLPSGTLKLSFSNDSDNIDATISGDYLIKMAVLNESVEENGIGGILRIPDIEFELYDRNGTFSAGIFDTSTLTFCTCKAVLNVGGTDYTVLYGNVDLSTIEYTSYYDDESGTERHSVKFVVFSLLKQLELTDMGTLRNAIDAYKVSKTQHVSIQTAHAHNSDAVLGSAANTAIGGSTASWNNPNFAQGPQDLQSADVTLPADTNYSDYLNIQGFFTAGLVPTSATIKGFKFIIHLKTDVVTGVKEHSVKFVKDGAVSGNELASGSDIAHPTTYHSVEVGSESEMGGLTFTPAQANAVDFGIAFAVKNANGIFGSVQAFVDYIECYCYYDLGGATYYAVKEMEILAAVQAQLPGTKDSVTHAITQTFRHTDASDPTVNGTYDDLYHLWKDSTGKLFTTLWEPLLSYSLSSFRDTASFLKALCGMRCSYPILIYTPSTGHIHLKIKQRNGGTAFTSGQLGMLKESSLQTFNGYDAFRIKFLNNALNEYFPTSLHDIAATDTTPFRTSPQFDLIPQKFDFDSYFAVSGSECFNATTGVPNNELYMYVTDGSHISNVNHIIDGSTDYPTFADFLLAKFESYWGNAALYTGKYQGTGIGGANPVEILDRITVDGVNYTIIEITRDLIADEMTIKAVSFT